MPNDPHVSLLTAPSSGGRWIQRALLAVAATSFALIAIFFVTVAIIVATFAAVAIGARWWWIVRKLRARAKATEALEGEYTVVERRVSELER